MATAAEVRKLLRAYREKHHAAARELARLREEVERLRAAMDATFRRNADAQE